MRNRIFLPILIATTVALPVRAESQNPPGAGQPQAGSDAQQGSTAAAPAAGRSSEAKKALKAIHGPAAATAPGRTGAAPQSGKAAGKAENGR